MQGDRVPPWCHWHVGPRPLLLIAPHGGRCHSTVGVADGRALKVNDVHTADLTMLLAARLNASFIINTGLDRNELDLNRISQVRSRAPWFVELIEQVVDTLVRRHAAVEVVFIHGWNVIQAKCDIGVGAHLPEAGVAEQLRTHLTVSPRYVVERLEPLRAHCARIGVRTSYGERYPASHPNNLLQLFRRGGAADGRARSLLTHLAAAGRIDAIQLEIGVPLRWNGRWRDEFVTTLARTFDGERAAPTASSQPELNQPTVMTAASLMFHDRTSQLGLISGIAGTPSGAVGGRLVIFLDDRQVALFTGEDRGPSTSLFGGPVFQSRAGGFDLSFNGPALEVDDGGRYVHLEDAFHHSRLIAIRLQLSFRESVTPEYGAVAGTIEIDGRTHRIDTNGFTEMPLLQRTTRAQTARLVVVAGMGAEMGIVATASAEAASTMTYFGPAGRRTVSYPTLPLDDQDGNEPSRFVMPDVNGSALVALPLSRMRIRRPLGSGQHQLITLGVARVMLPGHQPCFGFYEFSRRMDNAASGQERAGNSAVKLP